jgi:nitrogen-specific signal transduction histidine kinase
MRTSISIFILCIYLTLCATELYSQAPERKTVIRVINNGEPIPAEMMDKIFVPFFSSKKNGAGIGLFRSRQIIGKHGGSISSYTNRNSETVFKILLN